VKQHQGVHLCTVVATCLSLATAAFAQDASILSGYTLSRGPVALAGVEDDFSGITYDAASDTLFGIQNDPTRIVVLDKNLNVARTVDLVGFDDTEGICHVEGQRFAVVEERRRFVCEFDMNADSTKIAYGDVDRALVEKKDYANKGIEGIAYIPAAKQFVIVKEKKPLRVYSITRASLTAETNEIAHPWDAHAMPHGVTDLSGIAYDPQSDHLLVLSDESRAIIEVTRSGEKVGVLSLAAGSAGLKADIPQPEGITLGKDGTLYVASEPNLVFEFRRP